MRTLVNKGTLKAMTKKELLEKYNQYQRVGVKESNGHSCKIAGAYLKEYNKRKKD